jgi:hypothetical protein
LNLPKTPIWEPRGDRNEGGRSASPKCPSLNRSRLQSGFYRSRWPTSTRRFIQGPFIMSSLHASEIPPSRREPDDDAAETQPSPSCCRHKVWSRIVLNILKWDGSARAWFSSSEWRILFGMIGLFRLIDMLDRQNRERACSDQLP